MRISFIILTGIIAFSTLNAENSSRFPLNPSSEWRVNYEEMEDDTIYRNGDERYRYFIENDTLINSILYYKLYKTGIAYYDTLFQFHNIYIGAIRDDADKIYFIEKDKTSEVKLYDFNINLGDTISSIVEKDMEVTSIEILSDGRKKINIHKTNFHLGKCSNYSNTYLIEGIGSMGGIFYDCPCDHVGFREHYLVCYSENGNLVYQSDLSPISCESASLLNDPIINPLQFIVHQDKSGSKLIIEFKKKPKNNFLLKLYDISGVLILNQLINDSVVEVDIQQLVKGVFIVQINDMNSTGVQKIIIE